MAKGNKTKQNQKSAAPAVDEKKQVGESTIGDTIVENTKIDDQKSAAPAVDEKKPLKPEIVGNKKGLKNAKKAGKNKGVIISGAHQSVSVSEKTAHIISKFK